MCGIIAYFGKDTFSVLIKGLQLLQNRGYDSAGICSIKNNKFVLNKINQIAKKNKVLLNPTFDVVDLTKIKNIQKKLR